MESIKAERTDAGRNTILLSLMYRKSFADFRKLIDSLQRTKQSLVISLLSSAHPCRSVDDVMKSRLRINRGKLIELINIKPDLLADLRATDCISGRQLRYIESAETQDESIARLLDVIRRGSEIDFNKFITSLRTTGQEQVVSVLLGDGVVVQVVAKTSCCVDEETLIVERFKELLRRSYDAKREHLYAEVTQVVNELRDHGVETVAANTRHSIGVFYLCHSLAGLQYLGDLHSSGELERILQRAFTRLLNDGRSVVVDCLLWDMRDYMRCMQDICAMENLTLFSELYELYQRSKCPSNPGSTECTRSSISVDQFPPELLQLLLLKAVGRIFVNMHRVTPLAEVYSLVTLGAVSRLWRRTLTYRRHIRRVLTRYFRRVRSPFKRDPGMLPSLSVEDVGCLTEFNGKLYIGVKSSAVRVYVCRPPFSRLDDIKVHGLNDPSDIVACKDKSQLYIADYSRECTIWRVNLPTKNQVEKFIIIQLWPWSLSINSSRLLITPYDGDALFLYSDDGSQLNRIKLPSYMRAYHAVETKHNTYIVSHSNRFVGDTQPDHNSVSELDVNERVVRTFSGQFVDAISTQFNRAYYLALDGNSHVIVADRFNERIVVLDSDLRLKQVLIPALDGKPYRLCLCKETGLLFVCYWRSPGIDIYEIYSSKDRSEGDRVQRVDGVTA